MSNVFDQFDESPDTSEPSNVFDQFDAGGANVFDQFDDPEPELPEEADGDLTWGDLGRSVMAGGAEVGAGMGWLARKAGEQAEKNINDRFGFEDPGIGDAVTGAGESLQQVSQDAADTWRSGLSDYANTVDQQKFLEEDPDSLTGYKFGDAGLDKVKMMLAGSSLGTAAGMGAGAAMTKGLSMLPGVTRGVAATLGYSSGEALVAAPAAGAQAEQEVRNMSHEELSGHVEYQALLLTDVSPDEAREQLASAAGGQAAATTAISTAILSSPFGKILDDVMGGQAGNFGTAILKGGAAEGAQETLQSGGEQLSVNAALLMNADPDRALMQDVPEAMVSGLAAGTAMGGAFGGAGNIDAENRKRNAKIQLRAEEAAENARSKGGDELDAQLAMQQVYIQEEGNWSQDGGSELPGGGPAVDNPYQQDAQPFTERWADQQNRQGAMANDEAELLRAMEAAEWKQNPVGANPTTVDPKYSAEFGDVTPGLDPIEGNPWEAPFNEAQQTPIDIASIDGAPAQLVDPDGFASDSHLPTQDELRSRTLAGMLEEDEQNLLKEKDSQAVKKQYPEFGNPAERPDPGADLGESGPAAREQKEAESRAALEAQYKDTRKRLPAREKANQGAANENMELLQAIAAEGGLDRDEAIAQGIDPASMKKKQGRQWVFRTKGERTKVSGESVVTAQKGRSFDDMAETLGQMGFFAEGEEVSGNSLLNKVARSLGGEEQHSQAGMEKYAERQAVEHDLEGIERQLADLKTNHDDDVSDPPRGKTISGLDDAKRELNYTALEAEALGVPESVIDDILDTAATPEQASERIKKEIQNEREFKGWLASPAGDTRSDEGNQAAPRGQSPAEESSSETEAQTELAPELFDESDPVDAARSGDKAAQEKLESFGLSWDGDKKKYRRASGGEVEKVLAGETVESDRGSGYTDITDNPDYANVPSDSDYRITFNQSEKFDSDKEGGTREKNKDKGEYSLHGGYSLDDIQQIERKNENGEWEVVYSGESDLLGLAPQEEQAQADAQRLEQDAANAATDAAAQEQRDKVAAAEMAENQIDLDSNDLFNQPSEIDSKANEAATSPENDLPDPTEAQKEAGNYKKGDPFTLHGQRIVIENPKDSTRSGKDKDGAEWSNTMGAHYGDIKGTTGADGDALDVFVGPNPESEQVFIIDQQKDRGDKGGFDEHKIMMGFPSQEAAEQAYLDSYDAGWKVGPVSAITLDELNAWLENGDTTKAFLKKSQASTEAINLNSVNALDYGTPFEYRKALEEKAGRSLEKQDEIDALQWHDHKVAQAIKQAKARYGTDGEVVIDGVPYRITGHSPEWSESRKDVIFRVVPVSLGRGGAQEIFTYGEFESGESKVAPDGYRLYADKSADGGPWAKGSSQAEFTGEWSETKGGRRISVQQSRKSGDWSVSVTTDAGKRAKTIPAKSFDDAVSIGRKEIASKSKPPASVPQGGRLYFEFNGNRAEVESLADAQAKFTKLRNALEQEGAAGARAMGTEFFVFNEQGEKVAKISYNGRLWDMDGNPMEKAVEAKKEPAQIESLSEKEFYKKYVAAHKDIRSDDKGATKAQILADGFHAGINVNALPIYKGHEKGGNVITKKYQFKAGDMVYLLPKSGVVDGPNGLKTKKGYKPAANEVVEVKFDGQSAYSAYNGEADLFNDPEGEAKIDDRNAAIAANIEDESTPTIYRNEAGTQFFTITGAANGDKKYQVTVWDKNGAISDSKHDTAEAIIRHYSYGHEFKHQATEAEFAELTSQGDAGVVFVADYYVDKGARELSHKVKDGDAAAIKEMAEAMAARAPRGAVFIPAPSRSGKADQALQLANIIAEKTGGTVSDIISGKSRESLYDVKKRGDKAGSEFFGFETTGPRPDGNVYIVDSVYDTGATATQLAELVGADGVLVYAKVNTTEKQANKSRLDATKKKRNEKPLSEITLTEKFQDEDGNVVTVEQNAEVALRQVDKRLGVMDKLLKCVGG